MLSGVKTAIQVATGLIALQAGVATIASGGDMLTVLWSIGWVAACLICLSFWLMLPFEGLRRGAGRLRHRALLSDDATWIAGAVCAFVAGIVSVQWALGKEDNKREAETAFSFFHGFGIAALLILAALGYGLYKSTYSKRYQRCDDCLSMVPRGARVCRYCRYEFAPKATTELAQFSTK